VHNTTKLLGVKIPPFISNVMALTGQVPMRSKIVTGNTMLKQVNTLLYLEFKISYEQENDVTLKRSILL
jgi:hypothetical protein